MPKCICDYNKAKINLLYNLDQNKLVCGHISANILKPFIKKSTQIQA